MIMINYEFWEQYGIVLIKLSGTIEKTTLISFLEYLIPKIDNLKFRKVIMDFRKAHFNINIDEVESFKKVRLNFMNQFKSELTIYLVERAYETAFLTLVANEIPEDVSKIQVCSTLERIIMLMDIDTSIEMLDEKLNHLQHSF